MTEIVSTNKDVDVDKTVEEFDDHLEELGQLYADGKLTHEQVFAKTLEYIANHDDDFGTLILQKHKDKHK